MTNQKNVQTPRVPIFNRIEDESPHVKIGSSIDTKKKEPTSPMSVWCRIKHTNVENYHGKEFSCEVKGEREIRSNVPSRMKRKNFVTLNTSQGSLKDGGQSTIDELKEVNLGTIEEPRPTFISASFSSEEEGKYMSLLTEYKDIFAWSYKEMSRLDPKDSKGNVKSVGATYQRAMQKVFDDMLHKYVECYVDDLVVKSKRRQDYLKDLKVVFDRLQKYQLRMNPLKCAFGVTS
ncbi:retrotransposon protein, putative, unclassified [Cucumis melo var. makuwa]|uniref:Retrotransposon protein, putative, unclassified n=1 Tax=Cucumis melo var. makuwa TaxID=1194695 RepID=A0A5D3C8M9_CUCMM|nr:retrotransposon protein, putative, unclassified [Cucumis melo var. makuwa]TYK07700.1 retrotransposon protein, putative, unclassified [Cucumis melo var. makuwa]